MIGQFVFLLGGGHMGSQLVAAGGYAFLEFEKEGDMREAYKKGDGIKINGRRVLVDVERGRTVRGWLPRRLGIFPLHITEYIPFLCKYASHDYDCAWLNLQVEASAVRERVAGTRILQPLEGWCKTFHPTAHSRS